MHYNIFIIFEDNFVYFQIVFEIILYINNILENVKFIEFLLS